MANTPGIHLFLESKKLKIRCNYEEFDMKSIPQNGSKKIRNRNISACKHLSQNVSGESLQGVITNKLYWVKTIKKNIVNLHSLGLFYSSII